MSTTSAPAPTGRDHAGRLGLPAATALIMGGIIGTGVFTLPASIAAYGWMAIIALVVVSVGALMLALMFGSLAKREPDAGGPYAYARHAFGDFAGFTTAWPYWITAWAGNAAIVVGWTFYVEALFGWDDVPWTTSAIIAMVGLWLPAAINLVGVRSMGAFQIVTTILKFLPLAFISTIGLFFAFREAQWPEFNPSGDSWFGALSTAGALLLFSYLGVETASVAAAKVRNPAHNVPRATVYGTLACAAVYIFSTLAIFGIVPNATIQSTGAPFTDAFAVIFGGSWAGTMVAAFAVISGIGALNGWTMICAEMPQAAAADGLFPSMFGKVSRRGVPWVGIVFSTALASAFTLFSYATATGVDVFTTLVLLTGVTAAIPYFFSALAQLYYLFTHGRELERRTFARDATIAVLAMLFSFWFVFGSGETATYWAYLMILVGYVVLLALYVVRWRSHRDDAVATVSASFDSAPTTTPSLDGAPAPITEAHHPAGTG